MTTPSTPTRLQAGFIDTLPQIMIIGVTYVGYITIHGSCQNVFDKHLEHNVHKLFSCFKKIIFYLSVGI